MERLFVLLLIDALGILLMSPLILLALVNSDDAFLSAAVLPLSIGRDCCAVPNAARGDADFIVTGGGRWDRAAVARYADPKLKAI